MAKYVLAADYTLVTDYRNVPLATFFSCIPNRFLVLPTRLPDPGGPAEARRGRPADPGPVRPPEGRSLPGPSPRPQGGRDRAAPGHLSIHHRRHGNCRAALNATR